MNLLEHSCSGGPPGGMKQAGEPQPGMRADDRFDAEDILV